MLRKLPERMGYCYERASECRVRARKARTRADAQYYLDRECRWLLLARSCELSDRIQDFTKEVARRRLYSEHRVQFETVATWQVRCTASLRLWQ
jgi:hypothetical protein